MAISSIPDASDSHHVTSHTPDSPEASKLRRFSRLIEPPAHL